MKIYQLCFLVLATVFQVSLAENFVVDPAIFSATSQKNDKVLSFCFGYFPRFYKLPQNFQESTTHHMVFVERDAVCNDTVSTNVTDMIVITNDGQCGNLGKVHTLQNLGAWGVLIVNNATLTKSITSFNVTADDIHIFTGMISQSYKKAISSFDASAVVQLRAESYSILNSVFLIAIAVLAVMIGSYCGGTKRYNVFKKIAALQEEMKQEDSKAEDATKENDENNTKDVGSQVGDSKAKMLDVESNIKNSKRTKPDSKAKKFDDAWNERTTNVTKTFAVIMVLTACVLLLLLYFFYSYLASVLLVVYLILLTFTCISVLQKIIGTIPHLKHSISLKKCSISVHTIIAAGIAIPLSVWWYITRHESYSWAYQDILGLCFIITALTNVRMPNMKIITFILGLLFIYDIFFVFITPFFMPSRPVYFFQTGESVMVKVAMGDGNEMLPIALRIPMFNSFSISICEQYSMLGFGDMLVPGLVLSYCYGFDLENKLKMFYFILTSVFYTFGLIMAVVASRLMNSGQPALLYIVPSIVIPVIVASLCRNEFKDIWHGMPKPMLPSEESLETKHETNLLNTTSSRGPSLLDTQNQPNNNDL